MNIKKIKNYIIFLTKKIEYLNYNYYVLSKSQISDFKYDKLLKQLEYLNKKYFIKSNQINKRNKYNLLYSTFLKHFHISKMLSIKNTYNIYDFKKFNNHILKILNFNKIKYCCEIKLDGIAINLIYKKGILFKMLTRGNGLIGENIINNLKYVNNIPIKLNLNKNIKELNLIEIKGEICISKLNFIYINKKLKNNKKFKTCRNAASGIIRNIKYKKIYNNILDFIPYNITINNNILNKNNNKYNNHFKNFNYIKLFGFKINNYIKLFSSINELINYYLYILKIKNKIKYDIDGIVIKVNNIKYQLELGNSSRFPNWLIAVKFLSQYKKTELVDIKYNIGKTGIITPIGKLNPIYISGILIKKVSLINFKKIKLLNLKIKSIVYIELLSGIIPKIKEVISNNKNCIDINIPKKCPFCNYNIESNINKLECKNGFFCKEQIKYKIKHFFSENGIYIHGVNKIFINTLLKKNIISSPIDIFKLNYKTIKENIKKNHYIELPLKSKKKINFSNFIYSLGINGIGKNKSEIISNKIKNINDLIKNDFNNLDVLNKSNILKIKSFIKNKNNFYLIKELINKYIIINYKL